MLAFGFRLLAFRFRLAALGFHLSAFSFRLAALNLWLPALRRRLTRLDLFRLCRLVGPHSGLGHFRGVRRTMHHGETHLIDSRVVGPDLGGRDVVIGAQPPNRIDGVRGNVEKERRPQPAGRSRPPCRGCGRGPPRTGRPIRHPAGRARRRSPSWSWPGP